MKKRMNDRRGPRTTRLGMERLEHRLLLTTVQQAGDTVTVDGSAINDQISFVATETEYQLTVNGVGYTYDSSAVSQFVIDGGQGDNSISLQGNSAAETARVFHLHGSLEGTSFTVDYNSFSDVDVEGSAGADLAYMYDSPASDNFYAYPQSGRMIGTGYENVVSGFEEIRAYATAGGAYDRADLFDSAGNDIFTSSPNSSVMRDTSSSYSNLVTSFPRVDAHANAAGFDKAYFYDSAGDDVFIGRPELAKMHGPGCVYLNTATDFERTYGFATAGGHDRADFYDSAGDDIFVGEPTFSYLRGAAYEYYTFAKHFDLVYVGGTTGNDLALLYGTDGNDYMKSGAAYSYMTGENFYNRVTGFGDVRGYGRGGYDQAYFTEISATDQVFGRYNYMRVDRSGPQALSFDFDVVRVYSNGNETATADVDVLDYVFRQYGNWS
ncbi:MAG: hypothetical protein WBF93_01535 [Pirellulales bacterium]